MRFFPIIQYRAKSSIEPTPAQLKAAEEAMYSAIFRKHPLAIDNFEASSSFTVREERQESIQIENLNADSTNMAPEPEMTRQESLRGALNDMEITTVEEFLTSFRENGAQCMENAYLLKHPVERSSVSGTLFTPLPEDVFALIEAQLSLLDDYLIVTNLQDTSIGQVIFTEAVLCLIRNLWNMQTNYRGIFLVDFESSIAAANDFMRMVEIMEHMMKRYAQKYPHMVGTGKETTSVVQREASDLVTLFSNDAVYASQRVVVFIMQTVQSSTIPVDLFNHEWEDVLTQNEVAVSMVKTFDDYLLDIRAYLDHDFLFHKVVVALVRSTVCFYLGCLVKKADQVRRAKKQGFGQKRAQKIMFLSATRAVTRISYDIQVFRDYFHDLAKEFGPVGRQVANELSVFVVLLECMGLPTRHSDEDGFKDFVVVVHKRTGAKSEVTRYFLSDIWLLFGPRNKHRDVEQAINKMHKELELVTSRLKEEGLHCPNSNDTTSLRLDEMLSMMYEERVVQGMASLCGG